MPMLTGLVDCAELVPAESATAASAATANEIRLMILAPAEVLV
jgi:hypothetical protein